MEQLLNVTGECLHKNCVACYFVNSTFVPSVLGTCASLRTRTAHLPLRGSRFGDCGNNSCLPSFYCMRRGLVVQHPSPFSQSQVRLSYESL